MEQSEPGHSWAGCPLHCDAGWSVGRSAPSTPERGATEWEWGLAGTSPSFPGIERANIEKDTEQPVSLPNPTVPQVTREMNSAPPAAVLKRKKKEPLDRALASLPRGLTRDIH